MATTNTSRVYRAFTNTANELGLPTAPSTADKLFSRAKNVIFGSRNASARKGINVAHDRPYKNRDGIQETFSSIVATDMPWAEHIVASNLARFDGGAKIMSECDRYVQAVKLANTLK